jgi:tetrahydromethanopterin S-methyltransferase subunit B
MASPSAELKHGFWIGLGVSLALAVWAMVQMLIARGFKRG